MRDRTELVETCPEPDHTPGPHRHVIFGGTCAHGTPSRFACHSCDVGADTSDLRVLTGTE